jgi:hypothetical protein
LAEQLGDSPGHPRRPNRREPAHQGWCRGAGQVMTASA